MDRSEVALYLRDNAVHTVIAMGTDTCGIQRGRRLSCQQFLDDIDRGIRCASFIHYATAADDPCPGLLSTGVPDVVGRFDLATLRLSPWDLRAAVVFVDWLDSHGESSRRCVRSELKRQVGELHSMGLHEQCAIEYEFFLIPREPSKSLHSTGPTDSGGMPSEVHCYGIHEGAGVEPIMREVRQALDGWIESSAPEWGHGQHELNLKYRAAVDMADAAILLKLTVKQVAARHGYLASFMAKWRTDRSGNSGHVHLSLIEGKDRSPVFFAPDRSHTISEKLEWWIGGQVALFRSYALMFAPFVNSYRRFKPGSFAPTNCSVGIDNRTAAFRVINHDQASTRVEHRIGGADMNPYLALAAIIAAGRHGLANQLAMPRIETGNCYEIDAVPVPRTLREAALVARECKVLPLVMTPELIEVVTDVALLEADVVERQVTDVERNRYMSIV